MTSYKKALIIYTSALSLCIAILIGILALFLGTYEKNLPEKAAEEFISSLNAEKLAELVEDCYGDRLTFETPRDIVEGSEAFDGELETAKLAKEYTFDSPVYRMISPLGDIGKFTLRASEKKALFGVTVWEIESVTIYEEALGTPSSCSICAIAGAEVYINGVKASDKYKTAENAEYTGKALVASDVKCDLYVIDGLYTEPKISFSVGGKTEEAQTNAVGSADYFLLTENSISVTLPSDAALTLDGRAADTSKAENGNILTAVSVFEQNIPEKLPRMVGYTIYCGETPPQIKVTHNGADLEPINDGDRYIYLYTEDALYSVKAVLPRGAELYLNDVGANESYALGTSEFLGLSDSKKYINNMPSGTVWEVSGLLCEPEIGAMMNGNALLPCYKRVENGEIYIEFYGETVEPTSTEKTAAEEFTRRYFKYTVGGAVGLDENLAELLAVMKEGSVAYKKMDRSRSSFMYVNQFKYTIKALESKNFIELGSNAFACDVDFDVRLSLYNGEKIYAGKLSLIAADDGNGYLVCDIKLDSETDD